MHAGACCYVLKTVAAEELIHAIRTAVRGEHWFGPGVIQLIAKDASPNREEELFSHFPPRSIFTCSTLCDWEGVRWFVTCDFS